MELVNCTPHELNIHHTDGTVVDIKTSGIVPIIPEGVKERVTEIDGVEIFQTERPKLEGLPAPKEEVLLIVSRVVAAAALDEDRNRDDLLCPGTLKRNEHGQPMGCCGLEPAKPPQNTITIPVLV